MTGVEREALDAALARADLEAENDRLRLMERMLRAAIAGTGKRAKRAEARIAAVEAVCDLADMRLIGRGYMRADEVRAALAGDTE